MQEFRDKVRMKVMTARGIVQPDCLGVAETPLDHAIIRLASQELRSSHLTTFFFAYHCSPSWEAISHLYERKLHKKVEVATLKRFAASSIKRLHDIAGKARSLDEWERQQRKRSQGDHD